MNDLLERLVRAVETVAAREEALLAALALKADALVAAKAERIQAATEAEASALVRLREASAERERAARDLAPVLMLVARAPRPLAHEPAATPALPRNGGPDGQKWDGSSQSVPQRPTPERAGRRSRPSAQEASTPERVGRRSRPSAQDASSPPTVRAIAAAAPEPARARLFALAARLETLAQDIDRTNRRVRLLCEQSIRHVDGLIALLAGGGRPVPTYGPRGVARTAPGTLAIDRTA